MNFLGKYSNSMGHLIMSIISITAGLILILVSNDGTMRGVGVGLILTSTGYWFTSSATAHTNGGNTNVPTQNSSPNP